MDMIYKLYMHIDHQWMLFFKNDEYDFLFVRIVAFKFESIRLNWIWTFLQTLLAQVFEDHAVQNQYIGSV